MLKEVEEYFATKKAAEEDYAARVSEAERIRDAAIRDAEDHRAEQEAWNAHHTATAPLTQVRDAQVQLAWVRLGLSEDPLVRYIGANIGYSGDHRSAAEKVLPHLPATVMQLREIAAQEEWCGEFNNHLSAARRAGFIVDDRTPAEAALEDWIESNVSNRYAPELYKRLDAAVKARVEAQLAEVSAVEASQVTADLAGEHEVQLGRVDTVWASVAATAPPTIAVADAEFVFRQAVRAVITGQGEMFEATSAAHPDNDAAQDGTADLEAAF